MQSDNAITPPKVKNRVTMGTSEWSVAFYGIVEFLRVHPVCRAVVAVVGIVLSLLFIAGFAGLKIPGVSTFVFLFVAPTLLWMATVSGSSFELVFPAEQAAAERKIAEAQFNATQTPEDALNLDFKRLSEYYAINQSKRVQAFDGRRPR